MSNPTLGAGQQFTGPFNILPDTLQTNPTTQNNSQFTPFYDIITTTETNFISNPPNPTLNATQQFTTPFNILPDTLQTNPTVAYSSQFSPASNIGVTIGIGNPILGFAPPIQQLSNPTIFDPGATQQLTQTPYIPAAGYVGNPFDSPVSYPSYAPILAPAGTRLFPESLIQAPLNVTGSFTNLTNDKFLRNSFGYASSIAAGALGFPQIGQSAQKVFNTAIDSNGVLDNTYFTLPFDQLTNKLNYSGDIIDITNSVGNLSPYPDFRAKRFASSFANQNANLLVKIGSAIGNARKDGAAASIRPGLASGRAGLYAGTSLSPAGAYALFNLNGVGQFGYGWGDHDNKFALRSDFTLRSQVNTEWRLNAIQGNKGKFARTNFPLEVVTPFRGDKVTVIDFGKRLLKNAYQWKPSPGLDSETSPVPKTSLTKDFIKFFLTGPTLTAKNLVDGGGSDDIIVFRAVLTSLADSFSPSWTDVKMIGRADPNYQYTGYGRSLSLGFDIVITDRDEIKPTWRKLNALAGYCAPKYDPTSIALVGPWMRITLGDLFHQTAVVMTSLSYTYDLDHSWEINIEGDREMFETPRKISVSCDFNVITDSLPQNNGRFFSLAKQYNDDNIPKQNNDNWLSDFESNIPDEDFNQGRTRGR
jgi:hypothetical protein